MAIADLVYIDAAGFHFPDYPTVLAQLQADYRTIYGADVYLASDSQDGQWLAIQAQSLYDTFALASAIAAGFSPSYATGALLSMMVKINGIRRKTSSFSTVDLRVVGQVGTTITNGLAEDVNGNRWALPATVVIPSAGEITVTASAVATGATPAQANTITKIATPTLGWQTVNNAAAATAGAPVERDAELRARQRVSTALPSLTVFEGTIGAVANLAGVTRYRGYENDTKVTDANGLPANSISIVVEGGDATEIATAIGRRKTPGTYTNGTTAVTVLDKFGQPNTIRFFRPTTAQIKVEISVTAGTGYTSAYTTQIRNAVLAYINGLGIGQPVQLSKVYLPANLFGTAAYGTFNITQIRLAKNAGSLAAADVAIAFNEVPTAALADITALVT